MNLESSQSENPTPELSSLVEALQDIEQRLDELTAGEVDTVASRNGRTFLLRRAQDRLRQSEAAKQAAILDALPAYVALLDPQGVIVAANRAWRSVEHIGGMQNPGHPLGVNYLNICEKGRGRGSPGARLIAVGTRKVLDGSVPIFSDEYSTHAHAQGRRYLMTATPLGVGLPTGAVIMHLDVTEQWRAEQSLRASEQRFRQMAENISDVFFLLDARSSRMLYVSPAYERICGRSSASLYANPGGWVNAIHADDRTVVFAASRKRSPAGQFASECRIVRPDDSIRWIEIKGTVIRDEGGRVARVAGVAQDITDRKKSAQELRESERRFSDLLRHVELASVMLDRAGRITFCNEYLLRVTGWREEEVIGRDWFDRFVPPQEMARKDQFLKLLGDAPEVWNREDEVLTRSGERRLMRWNHSVLRSGEGHVVGTASIGEDITEQRKAEVRIKHLNRVYAVLSGINALIVRARSRDELFREACRIAVEEGEFLLALIAVVDPHTGLIVPVSSAGADKQLLAKIAALVSSCDGARAAGLARVIDTKRPVVCDDRLDEMRVLLAQDYPASGAHSLALLPLIVADEGVGVLALFAREHEFFHGDELKLLTGLTDDIGFAIDHIRKQERLDYLAYYDVLTGLANRSLFCERLEQSVLNAHERHGRLALVLLDIERFRTINDTLGRVAGDQLLKDLAGRLSAAEVDAARLARIDTDVFAIIVSDAQTEAELAHRIEQRLAEVFGLPFRVGGSELRVSGKFGIAIFPDDGANADTLLRNADAALKNAKANGERYLFYTQTMNERVAEKLSLENRLRKAIDLEQFILYYQPKVSLAPSRIISCEALIRWNDPRTGLVPPAQFIPILEETGLIFEVGRWALRQAVADYLRWRAAGLNIGRIAVNVSPLQLRSRSFIAEVQEVIGVDGPAGAGLELEMTEGMIMESVNSSIISLQAIRAMGVTIAIDDFGTGFSSLSYLSKLPVDTLKIDRSFVADMATTPVGLALVSTIITLGHSLKLKVVAEGVETEEQARLLRLLSCDEMQGYLFSQPVPAEIFEKSFLIPVTSDPGVG